MIQKLIKALQKYDSFSVTSHMNLEGDALGSQIALYLLLKKMGKKVVMVNQDKVPSSYMFLPCVRQIVNTAVTLKVDAAIAVDCSDLFRTGSVQEFIARTPCVLNIDHHVSNSYFGTVNWVDGNASSACQMVYQLCKKLKSLDKQIALCLYTGMVTDTGSFTYSNTTSQVHGIVSDLLTYDISPQKINHALHSAYEIKDIHFLGRLMGKVRQDAGGRIAWLQTKQWPPELNMDLTETVFSFLRLLKDAEVLVLFKETPSKDIRVNFRSKGKLDVNKVARMFGGGGHCTASGATVKGTLKAVEREVVRSIKKLL